MKRSSPRTPWSVVLCLALSCASVALPATGCASRKASVHSSVTTGRPMPLRTDSPPAPENEIRGMFVVTAFNIDWPSQPGLPVERAEDEIDAIIARAVDLNMNAIFLQVRAFGDRLYEKIDPRLVADAQPLPKGVRWAGSSDPSHKYGPGFDPLAVWISKAHASGLELHAWINPFRIDRPMEKPNQAGRFFASFDGGDGFLYLDARNQDVQDYVICTVHDLLNNYSGTNVAMTCPILPQETATPQKMLVLAPPATSTADGEDDDGDVDGIIIDHYLPPPGGGMGMGEPMLDTAVASAADAPPAGQLGELNKVQKAPLVPVVQNPCLPAGKLNARRQKAFDEAKPNMDVGGTIHKPYDVFIERLHNTVKAHKVRFGVSPCEAQRGQVGVWMRNKWMDYVAPEIYVEQPATFRTRLTQWIAENTAQDPPMLVPVLYTSRVQTPAKGNKPWDRDKIAGQIDEARLSTVGQIHYSYHALRSPIQGGRQEDNLGELLNGKHYENAAGPKWSNKISNNIPDIDRPAGTDVLLDLAVPVRRWLYQFWDGQKWGKIHKLGPKDGSIIRQSDFDPNAQKIRAWAHEQSGEVTQKSELQL